jgi:hypothetical protein
MIADALESAAAGWEIFPCKWAGPQVKAPLTVNGQHDATTNPDKIKLWWGRWPYAHDRRPSARRRHRDRY